MEQEKSNDDWNIVEDQPTCDNQPTSLGNFSQSIIVGTLNNRLNDISQKMDLILNKLDNLDKRLQNIENANLEKSEYDPVIFNNPDIEKILNLGERENETKEEIHSTTNTINIGQLGNLPISRTNLHSPLFNNLNSNLGLKYLSNNYRRTSASDFSIPFSSPY